MADWTNPVLTSQYTVLLDILKDRDFDLATLFSPSYSTGTNIPEGAVRWNPTSKIWEIRNASAGWDPLATKYNIDVDKLDGQHGAYYLDWNNFTNKPATFAPSAHTHDDRYYTETEADGRFGFTLDNNGNNLRLRAADGTVLVSHTVGYATNAGDAATVAGFSVGQNLRIADIVQFAEVQTTGNVRTEGNVYIGKNGGGDSNAYFYDDNTNTWRTFQWDDSVNDWRLEDNAGTMRRIFHEGHVPTWSEVSGKPTTFAPSAHGHVFDGTNRLQIRGETDAANATLTGLGGELVFESTNGRLVVHDGATLAGRQVAYTDDIPAPTNLSNYARKDQAETFASTLDVTGNFTGAAQVQMQKGRILDNSAAGTTKTMLSIEGDAQALQIINYSAGDYEIKNPGRGNSIRLLDGAGGVQVRTNSATRLLINDSGIEVYGDILLNGNTMWHSGNDGASSGLDADKVDGLHAGRFLTRYNRTHDDVNTLDFGIHGIYDDNLNRPSGADWGVVATFRDAESSIGLQIAGNHYTSEFHIRGGNPANFGGTGSWQPWRKLWHDGNDGAGSGLDADKLDGVHASSFVRNDSSQTLTNTITIQASGTIAGATWNNGWLRIGNATQGWSFDSNEMYNSGAAIIGTLAGDLQFNVAGNVKIGSSRVLTTADDGSLAAATVGGLSASQFLRSDAADTGTNLTLSSVKVTAVEGISWENGVNWITHNDGGGNVQIRFGHRYTNTDERFSHTGTAFYIGGNQDINSGTLQLKVASNGGAGTGASVTWGNTLDIGASTLTWGGNTIWHSGNDGAGSGLDADTVDGLNPSIFMRTNASTSTSGNLTVGGTLLTTKVQTSNGTQLVLNAGESAGKVSNQTGEQVYVNAEGGLSVNTPDAAHSNWQTGYSVKTAIIKGDSITLAGNKVFHDGYHPNADKLTTARTIALSGDVSGSVSFNGTGNVTITTTVANDSHTHDSRYLRKDTSNSVDLRLASGHGRGLRFWDSDQYKIYMSSQGDGTWGGRLDGSSDYNMYFRMTGGTNRGFVFANGSTPKAQIEGNGNIRSAGTIYANNIAGNWKATSGEATAGAADNVVMTPLRTKEAIDTLGGLPRLTPGGGIRSRRDAQVSRYLTSYSTRHYFNFIQKGTIRVKFEAKASHAGKGAAVRIRRYRDETWTTMASYTMTTTYVTKTYDIDVTPGDQLTVEYRGGGTYQFDKTMTYYYGYLKTVRFQTGGVDLYPGVSYKVENNSA